MAVTKITYTDRGQLAVTVWDTALDATQWATSAIHDNTSNLDVDVLVGGLIELGDGTPVVGDTLDIYVGALYEKGTTSTPGGGIDSLMDPGTPAEEVEDVDFVKSNLILFTSIGIELAAPSTLQSYAFNPKGVAQYFGGILPEKIFFMLHMNTAANLITGSALEVVGITYTTA